jgi:hypothetical protein
VKGAALVEPCGGLSGSQSPGARQVRGPNEKKRFEIYFLQLIKTG